MFKALNEAGIRQIEEEFKEPSPPEPQVPVEDGASIYLDALRLIKEDQLEAAINRLESFRSSSEYQSLARKSDDLAFFTLRNLADCYLKLQKSEDVVKVLKEACDLRPKNADCWYKLGTAYLQVATIYDALPALQTSFELSTPTCWPALTKLCQCFYALGLYDECAKFAVKGLQINPWFPTAHTFLLTMLQEEPNLVNYWTWLRPFKDKLTEDLLDTGLVEESRRLQIERGSVKWKPLIDTENDRYIPSGSLRVGENASVAFVDLCGYLVAAFDEAAHKYASVPLVVHYPIVVRSRRGSDAASTSSSEKIGASKQQSGSSSSACQAHRQSRRSAVMPQQSSQTVKASRLRLRLGKLVTNLKASLPEELPVEVTSASPKHAETDLKMEQVDALSSQDFKDLLNSSENQTLYNLSDLVLTRAVQLASTLRWNCDEAANFCALCLRFKEHGKLKPPVARILLESITDFLASPLVGGEPDTFLLRDVASLKGSADVSYDVDTLRVERHLDRTDKSVRGQVSECLMWFRYARANNDYDGMHSAAWQFSSVLDEAGSTIHFDPIFQGHVPSRHVWSLENIRSEMRWANCFQQLQTICDQMSSHIVEESSKIVESGKSVFGNQTDIDFVLESELANGALVFAKATLVSSVKTEFLADLLSKLTVKVRNSNRGNESAKYKRLLAEAWSVALENFETVVTKVPRVAHLALADLDFVLDSIGLNEEPYLPFDFTDLFRFSLSLLSRFSLRRNSVSETAEEISSRRVSSSDNATEEEATSAGSNSSDSDSESDDYDSDFSKLPNDCKFAIIIHDLLSLASICRSNSGAYLNIIRDQLVKFLSDKTLSLSSRITRYARTIVERAVDQCFYCFSGMNLRKNRSKQMQVVDHGIALTAPMPKWNWELVFDAYRYYWGASTELPDFDSFKGDSIQTEVFTFLKKALNELDPLCDSVLEPKDIEAYLTGSGSEALALSSTKYDENRHHLGRIHYLLADYVLKNQNQYEIAAEDYKRAVTFDPSSWKAWIGLALSLQTAAACELDKWDETYAPPSVSIIKPIARCFQHALSLAEGCDRNGKLIMEFGSFVYEIYDLLDRAIKWDTATVSRSLRSDLVVTFLPSTDSGTDALPSSHEELLKYAGVKFSEANSEAADFYKAPDEEGAEERWFCLYMMGKVETKLRGMWNVTKALDYYLQAYKLLIDCGAAWPPSKMSTSQSPKLCVEAMEVFYRIHVDILKYVLGDLSPVENLDKAVVALDKVYSYKDRLTSILDTVSEGTSMLGELSSPPEIQAASSVDERKTALGVACLRALTFISNRFNEHFKSRYHIARALREKRCLSISSLVSQIEQVLLGRSSSRTSPLPTLFRPPTLPLFDVRRILNGQFLLSGFWRSPHPDIDRRGSFVSHASNCIGILLKYLYNQRSKDDRNWGILAAIHAQLAKPPTAGKKYLRQPDQDRLAVQALEWAVHSLANSPVLLGDSALSNEWMLEVYRLHQQVGRTAKNSNLPASTSASLCTAFARIQGDVRAQTDDVVQQTLRLAEKYCQKLATHEKQQAKRIKGAATAAAGGSMAGVVDDVEQVLRSLVSSIAAEVE